MNRSTLIQHLLLKDLRHQRGWLALLWILALLIPLLAPIAIDNLSSTNPYLVGTAGGYDFLLVLILIRVIQLDPPGRNVHFLATRPVSGDALVTSKALFIGLFLMVTVWIAKLGAIYMAGIPFTPLDAALCVVESAIEAGALLALVAMFALFIRSLPVVFLSLIAAVTLYFVVATILRQRLDAGAFPQHVDTNLSACRFLLSCFFFVLTVSAGAVARYRSRSLRQPVVILAVGIILSWEVPWFLDLSRWFSDHRPNLAEVAPPLRDNIHLVPAGSANYFIQGGNWQTTHFDTLEYPAKLTGMEAPYFAVVVDYQSEATLRSGHVIRSSYHDSGPHWWGAAGGMTDALRQQIAGFNPQKIDSTNFEVFQGIPSRYPHEDLTGARVKGVLTLEIRRAVVLKTAPLKDGVTVSLPRLLYTLRGVQFSPGSVDFTLISQEALLTLRGDSSEGINPYSGPLTPGGLSWLVVNRAKGEYLNVTRSDGGGDGPGVAFYRVSTYRYSLWTKPDQDGKKTMTPFPPDWGHDAQIFFFTSESCGRMSFPFEMQNVNLTNLY